MLEVKNLVKKYSGKGGVTVKALDDVSVKFPETGMVFLLGRSGSGKSTLLNVAGGLDKPDGGEIIVKGRSSKSFSSADFDSYRNTFVGFVFQEYNILNEFSIEQNIALALQLQNKPNNKKAVNELLKLVDLDGYGKRKPNTLSGGQKQRVAIARALIKNPEIIMADEPTGALDSNTGKQVLDTLKKLSKEKLVIVVSHDREFAEYYGDRIIELKDGKILSDISKTYFEPEAATDNVNIIGDDTITIKNAESLTEKDVKSIVAVLKKSGGEAIITSSKNELKEVKRVCKINDDGSRETFKNTEKVDIKEYDGKNTRFIKSHLPLGHAVKMGSSGLKGKPIRLIFTILLSVIAFVMFGVASTFMMYDPNYSIKEAVKEADYPNVMVGKYYDAVYQNITIDNETDEEKVDYEREEQYQTRFTPEEVAAKNKEGLKFAGVFTFNNSRYYYGENGMSIRLGDKSADVKSSLKNYYSVTSVTGFSDCGVAYMHENGFTLIEGTYPSNKNEVAIPEYIANLFVNTESSGINTPSDMVDKEIKISIDGSIISLTVTAVYKVGDIPSKYDTLKTLKDYGIIDDENTALSNSLNDFISHSFHTILFVSDDFYDSYKYLIRQDGNYNYVEGEYYKSLYVTDYEIDSDYSVDDHPKSYYTEKTVSHYPNSFAFFDINGAPQTSLNLSDNQVYVNYSSYMEKVRNRYSYVLSDYCKYDSAAKNAWNNSSEKYGEEFLNYLRTWYSVLAYKDYIYNAADDLKGKYGYVKPDGFEDAYNKVNSFINSGGAEPTSEEWDILIDAVSNDYKTYFPQEYYYVLASEMMNIDENVFDDLYTYVYKMQSGSATNEEYTAIVNIIGEKYAEVTGKELPDKITENNFNVSTANIIPTVYYKDKMGEMGTLTVAGYFVVNSSNASYLLSSTFLAAHGTKDNMSESKYTWITREKTDYVEPTNAKYNYIISKTDNSSSQLSAVLESDGVVSYKISSNVCDEVYSFSNLVKELQTIFLIIALVVGVFAALMLLNFISVSISSKRKEIGILRAVGARGSDVFKIFFAEAFIIAIICFILATIGSYIVCYNLNNSLADIINAQMLDFNIINVAMIFGISICVSIIATFLPVFIASRKSPVESIRAL